MKKKVVFLFLCLCLSAKLLAGQVTIIVRNPTDAQRQEVVDVDAGQLRKALSLSVGDPVVIRNAAGVEIPYQFTYEDKLLLDVAVHSHGEAVFSVSKGQPLPMQVSVKGALYKIRKDDIAWENDRGAYRVYGPALQKTGEKSFGTDIWVKNTPELVVEQRYRMDDEGNQFGDRLMREGKKVAADSVDKATSFHLDHGNGMDGYGVGPTLGCGAPALMDKGHLIYPYCYQTFQILDNGPLRFTVRLDYHPSKVGGDSAVIEHRIISLDKGSNFNRMTVWYDGLSHACDLATGVVLHGQENRVVLGADFLQYADPTDEPQRNNSEIYVACLFPDKNVKTMIQKANPKEGVNAVHALGIYHNFRPDDKFHYYFGSAWSEYDVRSQAEWQLRINEFMEALKTPLQIEIK
jgi:hypothetical protein